jgi:hypothetical protein
VIDVVTVITAKEERKMITTIEETETAQATAPGDQPKAAKKANVAKRARNVAPGKAKAGKKGQPCQERAQRREESQRRPPREGRQGEGRPGGQQNRDDPRTAETAGGRYVAGIDQSNVLAATLPEGLPLGYDPQKDGIDNHVDQG